MASRLGGYRRLAGSSRRYLAPSGETISYREYRARIEAANLRRPLDVIALANRRRSQRRFNDIIDQMSKVRRRALEIEIENYERAIADAEEIGDDDQAEYLLGELEDVRRQHRTVRSQAIKSPSRKEALRTLKENAHPHGPGGRPREMTQADELKVREALIALGRREGIPDWVPVGFSDRRRSGRLRSPANLPARFRGAR